MMTPTRAPLHEKNGILRTRQKLIVTAGAILTLFGFAALAFELWRYFWGIQPQIEWTRLAIAIAMLCAGLALIQTLNPLGVMKMGYRLYHTQYPGGRRSTDPPAETAPPHTPRERWPQVPPRRPPTSEG